MTDPVVLRVPFFHTPDSPFRAAGGLVCVEDGAIHVAGGRIVSSGAYPEVRQQAGDTPTLDWRGGYVLPGLIDTHVHYPQLRVLGGLGRSLLDWLHEIALPEEARMADRAYADETARRFVRALLSHGTTTALVFGAHFAAATAELFTAAASAGLRLVSGMVLSDRHLRPELHQTPEQAHRDSSELIRRFHGRDRLLYAVTPRFALSTTDAMLEVCQALTREHRGLRVQTHINEQPDEVAACLAAFPWASDYLSIYERYSLVGPHAVFAHGVHSTEAELERLASARASIAHCPCSNAALGSGIFPLRRHLTAGVHVALGTDVGGGIGFGLLKEALQAYLMQRVTPDGMPMSPAQLLYLATRAGAEALGLGDDTGDLSAGRSADLVYIRPGADSPLAAVLERADSLERALAGIITLASAADIAEVWVGGLRTHGRRAGSDSEPAEDVGRVRTVNPLKT